MTYYHSSDQEHGHLEYYVSFVRRIGMPWLGFSLVLGTTTVPYPWNCQLFFHVNITKIPYSVPTNPTITTIQKISWLNNFENTWKVKKDESQRPQHTWKPDLHVWKNEFPRADQRFWIDLPAKISLQGVERRSERDFLDDLGFNLPTVKGLNFGGSGRNKGSGRAL